MDDFIKRLFDGMFEQGSRPHPLDNRPLVSSGPGYGPDTDAALLPAPIKRKVSMITHNPVLHTQNKLTLKEAFNWNDSNSLAQGYINNVRYASYGYANYEIVERIEVDGYPVKADGFRYTEQSYLDAWKRRQFHQPDGVDYLRLVQEFEMIEKINSGEIDEVWLFGHPYGGYYESIMAGPGAFWSNAPELKGTEHATRKFIIMGFNFERGIGEMLEDLGHHAESMMARVYAGMKGDANLWERFIRYDLKYPGRAECGNVHFAPNSVKDYDWGNTRPVLSRSDTWYNFPELSGEPRVMNCNEWGDGDIRLHHVWWFRHFPHIVGQTNGISNNWWEYVIDPNRVPV